MNATRILASMLVVVLISTASAASRGRRKKLAPSDEVAAQTNPELFVRGENASWEGDDDLELTRSQEEGLVAPTVAWKKKKSKWQVPFVIDRHSNFSAQEVSEIRESLRTASKQLQVKFKAPQYETYLIRISSLKQCASNMIQKMAQPFNEIPICVDAKLGIASEIQRAVALGLQINRKISHDDDEESNEKRKEMKKRRISENSG